MAKKRFEVVLEESGFTSSKRIYVDTLTGVNYLFVSEGYAGGLTPLLGPDGKPVVTPTGGNPEL